MDTFGTYLRAKREEKKVTLEEIARETNIKLDYLQAIESETLSLFSDKVYARIFIKTYADYIGENPEMVVDMFDNSTHFKSFSRQHNNILKNIEQQNRLAPLQRRGQGLLVYGKNLQSDSIPVIKRLLSLVATLLVLGVVVTGLYLWLFTATFSETQPDGSFLNASTQCPWVNRLVFRNQTSIWEPQKLSYRFDLDHSFHLILLAQSI